ncbi:MAG: DUF4910 domain-containing protein [Vicinamibacterales bacterium]
MTTIAERLGDWNHDAEGARLHQWVRDLRPMCRSITGDGVRESLRRLQGIVALDLHEVRTGTRVFDWTVPKEWNIRDAFIKNERGERVVDFRANPLHVVSYSVPVRERMTLAELEPHLFTLAGTPDWIPYRTSYYTPAWGFCLTQRQLDALPDGVYDVCIDSTLEDGHLTYGEHFVRGASDREVLLSMHSCHPGLCNDNLSGMIVGARLAALLSEARCRYSYRFLWLPGTIGAITWLALHEGQLSRVNHGLVLTCVGDDGAFTYKRSRRHHAEIDRVVEHVLRTSGRPHHLVDFTPTGYDERQYCSPGIDLPVGCFMRTPNGRFPQYHTSADDLTLVTPSGLADSLYQLLRVVQCLEHNRGYVNLQPKCEPQLGTRGLYRAVGGTRSTTTEEALLWVLNYSDGVHSLLDIAELSGISLQTLVAAADALTEKALLAPRSETPA